MSISHLEDSVCCRVGIILKIQWISIRKISSVTVKPQGHKYQHNQSSFWHCSELFRGSRAPMKTDDSYEPSPVAAPEFLCRKVLGAGTYWVWERDGPALGRSDEWPNYPNYPKLPLGTNTGPSPTKTYIFSKIAKQFQGVHGPLRSPTLKGRSTLNKQVVPVIQRAKRSPLRAHYALQWQLHVISAAKRMVFVPFP